MASDAALEALVVESLAADIPVPTRRDATLAALPRWADAVIGMRRAGKTWFLYQQMRALLDAGVPRERLLYVNLEDDRLGETGPHDLGRLLDAYRRLRPATREGEIHLFLDEVQNAPSWPRFVRRVLDTENARVVFSGSSSRVLAAEIHTSMRGRSLPTEILPFSFREWLRHRGVDAPTSFPVSAKSAAAMQRAFAEYLTIGGFPDVQGLDADARTRVLQSYVDVVLLRDVLERHPGLSPIPARRLAQRLLSSPAGAFSVSRFHGQLASEGVAVGKNTLHDLLAALHDVFLVFPVEIDARSERQRTVNPRKVYPIDTGLAGACSHQAGQDRGRLLETAVYLELRRRKLRIAYHRTASRREVDFLVRTPDDRSRFVQVCFDLTDPATRERELAALAEALPERRGADAVIVTSLGGDEVQVAGRTVPVLPAWWWCLAPDAGAQGPPGIPR